MSINLTMPRLSDTMEMGTIIKWNVSEGDDVSAGDVVADVETDKATMEMQAFDDGKIARIVVPEGQAVDVGTVIAVLAEDGEDPSAVEVVEAAPASVVEEVEEEPPPDPVRKTYAVKTDERVRASPVARRLADEHGVDLRDVQGSGPNGRVIKRDVLGALEAGREMVASVVPTTPAPAPAPAPSAAPVVATTMPSAPVVPPPVVAPSMALESRRVPLSGVRQTIARRLVEAKTTIPHYQVTLSFEMERLLDLRKTLNEQLAAQGVKLSVNDFVMRACALAMYENPEFNASWAGDSIEIHDRVNIGMAVALPADRGGGLLVATIRDADRKSLRSISLEARALGEKARTRGLTIDEMSDSTFTVSNLGMFGVEHFTAIINPPNSAILAVGAAIEKPVVRNGELTVGMEMSATLSADHRIIDGAMAARYLGTVKNMLEHPATLMV